MRCFAQYPPVEPSHQWADAQGERVRAIGLWEEGKIAQASRGFLRGLRGNPQFPFLWGSYHRFLHDVGGTGGLPKDVVAEVAETDLFRSFSIYRFFGRCRVAREVNAGGWNAFEKPCPMVLAKWLRARGGTFIDVGANSGYYSLLAARAGAGRAIAFEPYAPAVDVMLSNIELNNLSGQIQVMQLAAAERECVLRFYLPMQTHGLLETSASQDPAFRPEHSFSFEVNAKTLDSLMGVLDSGPLTIKVDVEGVGPTVAVLKGAGELMRQRRPVMMVEYFEGPAEGLNRILKEFSYTAYVFDGAGSGFVERTIAPYPGQMNHFLVPSELAGEFGKVEFG
jgi:FkbM family methyltransferase